MKLTYQIVKVGKRYQVQALNGRRKVVEFSAEYLKHWLTTRGCTEEQATKLIQRADKHEPATVNFMKPKDEG